MKGFVISHPDPKMREHCWGCWTFAPTASEAWLRWMGHEHHDIDRPHLIQKWHDKGYRVREAELTVFKGEDEK